MSWPASRGENARRLRDFDGAATELGPQSAWPAELRTTLSLVLDSGVAMSLRIGPTLRLFYNDPFIAIHGKRHPAAFGRPSAEANPEVHAHFAADFDRVLAGEAVVRRDEPIELLREDRLVQCYFDFCMTPYRDADGAVVGIVSTVLETTGRVLAEQRRAAVEAELREREARLQLALEGAEMGTWTWDPLADVTVADERSQRTLGMGPDEHPNLRRMLDEVIVPEDQAMFAERVAAAIDPAGDGTFEVECRVVRPSDGVETWVRMTGKTRFAGEGDARRPELAVGTLQDIGNRRRVEASERESQARYRQLFDAIDQGFCLIDIVHDGHGNAVDYRFVETNAAFMRHTGLEGVVGRTIRELVPGHENHWFETYGRIARTGEPESFEAAAEGIGGRWYEVFAFRAGAPEQARVGVLFKDISERQRIAAEKDRLVQQLAEVDRRKDEFLATLAHELRNPLAPLTNAVHVIGLAPGDPQRVEAMGRMIERQLRHMVRLVDDLLDISRISRGQITLRRQVFDLAHAVRAAVETSRPLVDGQEHALDVVLPDAALYVDADETRLSQAISNLLNNAAKYTPRGGHLRLDVRPRGEEGLVDVVVQDDGIGIDPALLPEMFEMFAQAPGARGRSQGGLGLGLAIARRMVEMHGGSLVAHSEGAGRGSTFVLSLPTAAAAAADSPPAAQVATPVRVLVVDDNRDAADSMASLLRAMGHDARAAFGGIEGLAQVQAFGPRLVLVDIGMPDMDGLALARAIRGLPGCAGIVLVALTGWGTPDDRERSLAAGFNAHVAKPIDAATIERLLARVGTAHE